jgi:hypothetical protein
MKNFALTLLLTMLTLHLNAAVMHRPADTLQCDTFLLKNGIEVYARILEVSGDAYTVQFCNEDRKTSIPGSKLKAIRFSDGTKFGKSEIRREMRFERRAAKVFSPWRLAKTGLLQLLGVWPISLAALSYLFGGGSFGGGGAFFFLMFWLPPILTILLMMYLLFKGISNLTFAIRLKKQKKQESSF